MIYPSQTPEYRRASMKRWREANPERHKAKNAAWYKRNRDAIRARNAAAYRTNPEPAKRRAKQYALTHPERVRATRHAYKSARRKELSRKQMAYYYANHERELKKHAERRAIKRDQQRAFARMKSATVSDQYVREQLAKYSPLSMQDFPQDLVETKRVLIQMKRITHNRKKAA